MFLKEIAMKIETALVYLLIVVFAATVPVWRYSIAWGDHPSELVGMALIAVLLRILLKKDQDSKG